MKLLCIMFAIAMASKDSYSIEPTFFGRPSLGLFEVKSITFISKKENANGITVSKFNAELSVVSSIPDALSRESFVVDFIRADRVQLTAIPEQNWMPTAGGRFLAAFKELPVKNASDFTVISTGERVAAALNECQLYFNTVKSEKTAVSLFNAINPSHDKLSDLFFRLTFQHREIYENNLFITALSNYISDASVSITARTEIIEHFLCAPDNLTAQTKSELAGAIIDTILAAYQKDETKSEVANLVVSLEREILDHSDVQVDLKKKNRGAGINKILDDKSVKLRDENVNALKRMVGIKGDRGIKGQTTQ